MCKKIFILAMVLFVSACEADTQVTQQAAMPQPQQQQPAQQEDHTGRDAALGAGAGALAGSLLGNMLSRPSHPAGAPAPIQHVTVNKTIVQRNITVVRPRPSVPSFSRRK